MLSKIIGMAAVYLALCTQINAQDFSPKTFSTQNSPTGLFIGDFRGHANMTDYYLNIQNNNGSISGKFLTSSNEVYNVKGRADGQSKAQIVLEGISGDFSCTLHRSGNNIILELDKDFITSVKLLLLLAGEYEAALAMQSTVVMTPVTN